MQRRLALDGPIDVAETLRAFDSGTRGGAPREAGGAWWIGNTAAGPATLHVRVAGGEIHGEAWGGGADLVLDRLASLCGLDDDPAAFRPPPGPVADLHRRHPGLRIGRTSEVFDALVPVILGQRVASEQAIGSFRGIARAWGSPAPGPVEGWVAPPAEVLASLDPDELHPHGVERSRALILREAARRARRLEEAVDMDRDAAFRRLTAVRGIGPWTAGHVAGVALGDPDAVPVGDFHLPNTVAWLLAGEPRADDARMLELLEPYRPHRRRVMLLLRFARVKAPALAPKRPIHDIRGR